MCCFLCRREEIYLSDLRETFHAQRPSEQARPSPSRIWAGDAQEGAAPEAIVAGQWWGFTHVEPIPSANRVDHLEVERFAVICTSLLRQQHAGSTGKELNALGSVWCCVPADDLAVVHAVRTGINLRVTALPAPCWLTWLTSIDVPSCVPWR